jgi:hypothetical protein
MGPVTKRLGGPIDPWLPERAFCQYDRMLKFPASCPSLLSRDIQGLEFFGIKRRLYPATTRNDLFHMDVQIAGRANRFGHGHGSAYRRYEATQFDLVAVVTVMLAMRATVRSVGRSAADQQLARLGPLAASAFDAATTIGGPSGKVMSGAVAVVIEVEQRDDVVTTWAGRWELDEGLRLAARDVIFGGRPVSVFVVERSRQADWLRGRALRIHVLRLHAEREYLRRLVRLLGAQEFLDECDATQAESIQYALNQCLRTLTQVVSYGFPTAEIATAFVADRTLSGAELEVLMERVQTLRPAIGRRLRRLKELDDATEQRWRRLLEDNPSAKNFVFVREMRMSHYDQRGSQIGAAGENASASNFSFGEQLNLAGMAAPDIETLMSALRTLRKHLADRLIADAVIEVGDQEVTQPEIGSAIGAVSEAEQAITAGDEQAAQKALQRCGSWLASFAQGVGVEIAAAAIRSALHLP